MLAHAKAYRTYAKEFKRKQNGRIGIVNSAYWHDSKSEKLSDIEAADRANHFRIGWFSEPIFGKSGDYPSIMKRRVTFHFASQLLVFFSECTSVVLRSNATANGTKGSRSPVCLASQRKRNAN